MSKELVVKKGYTFKVLSWENDGDNYQTKFYTVGSMEQAKNIHTILEKNIGGNECSDGKEFEELIVELMSSLGYTGSNEELVDTHQDICYNLLGSCEWYYNRVCESITVTYSEQDIYVTKIKL